MRSRKLRFALALLPLALLISLIGFLAPGASAQGTITVEFVSDHQPTDAIKNQLITAVPFDPSPGDVEFPGPFVQVRVKEDGVPVEGADVTFRLATNSDSETDGPVASGTLTVTSEVTDGSGIATFDTSLSIAQANEPTFSGYELVPQATTPEFSSGPGLGAVAFASILTEGPVSSPFDIWGVGCKGDGCQVSLTPGNSSSDTYTTTENAGMGASQGTPGDTTIVCPTQQLIFASDLFFHATTGDKAVRLVSHISALDRKAAANNGNKVMGWCVGLKDPGPWHFAQQNTNGIPGLQTGDLYVGMAPKCPKKNATDFAPCILSQVGDGVGGTFIRGFLPGGGDPPRRT
jgi:hypothetical protein